MKILHVKKVDQDKARELMPLLGIKSSQQIKYQHIARAMAQHREAALTAEAPAQSDRDAAKDISDLVFKVSGQLIIGNEIRNGIIDIIARHRTQAATGWLPISGAPKDGTEMWLWAPEYFSMPIWGWYSTHLAKGWLCDRGDDTLRVKCPTHFMPIPKPPKEAE